MIVLPGELFPGDFFPVWIVQDILYHPEDVVFFFSFLWRQEWPFLSSWRVPALVFTGDQRFDFGFCVDIKSRASRQLKPNFGSDSQPPDHSRNSLYCCFAFQIILLFWHGRTALSPLHFFFSFCNINHVFTLKQTNKPFPPESSGVCGRIDSTLAESILFGNLEKSFFVYSFYLEWSFAFFF